MLAATPPPFIRCRCDAPDFLHSRGPSRRVLAWSGRSRFAGNGWVLQGTEMEDGSGLFPDRVFAYGGWGIDSSQTQHYLSDMWVALAPY
jgi:hypothetical protein